jgi:hypothetical protein
MMVESKDLTVSKPKDKIEKYWDRVESGYCLPLGKSVVTVNSEGIGPRDRARNAFLTMAASILFNHHLRKSDDLNDMLVIVAEMFPNATTAMIESGSD